MRVLEVSAKDPKRGKILTQKLKAQILLQHILQIPEEETDLRKGPRVVPASKDEAKTLAKDEQKILAKGHQLLMKALNQLFSSGGAGSVLEKKCWSKLEPLFVNSREVAQKHQPFNDALEENRFCLSFVCALHHAEKLSLFSEFAINL
jgi:hypothetical protein